MATKTKAEKTNGTAAQGWLDDPARKEKSAAAMEKFEEGAAQAKGRIVLPALEILPLDCWIIGDSELIVHSWSLKAKRQMLEKQTGEATAGREKKDPIADFLGSLYTEKPGKVIGDYKDRGPDNHPNVHIEGGVFTFPAIGVKNAMVTACTSLGKAIAKTAARQAFQVIGETFRVYGQPRMREDMVRLSGMNASADIRFRGAFVKWAMRAQIKYNTRVLSSQQLMNLLNTAGFAVGLGEWRPETNGSFGLFHVASLEEIKAVKAEYNVRD